MLPPKKKLLLDTNVWLSMVEDWRQAHLLTVVEELIKRNVLELIVPETVLQEFVFRRDDVAAQTVTSLASHLRAVRDALPKIPVNPRTLSTALQHLTEASQRIHVIGTGSHVLLDRIEALLRGRVRPNSNRVWQAAAKRAREGKAPCHHKRKNSISDALIIAAYAEELEQRDPGVFYGFVTLNVDDFSRQGGDQRLAHEDLAGLFGDSESSYFVNLLDALRAVDATFVAETMLATDPTVRDLIYPYVETIPKRRRSEVVLLANMPIGGKNAAALQVADLIEHCQSRRQTKSQATVQKDIGCLQNAFRFAAKKNPNISDAVFEAAKPLLRTQGLIGPSTREDRRPNAEHIDALISFFEGVRKAKIPAAELARFTLVCPLRIGDVCSLEWSRVSEEDRSCEIHGRRGREPFRVKFSPEAWEIIQRQPTKGRNRRIFPFQSTSVSARFYEAAEKLDLDISLDRLRDEGEVRLFLAGIGIDEIKAMTGRKDVNPLIARLQAARHNAQELLK